MRVQLSPWEISKTSIRVPTNDSRQTRKLLTTDDENDVTTSINGVHNRIEITPPFTNKEDDIYRFSARFVELSRKTVRTWKKQVRASFDDNEVLPSIVITSEHQIRLMGKSTNSNLSESINLQLTSPIGIETSFIPGSSKCRENGLNGSSNGKQHKIVNGSIPKHAKQLESTDSTVSAVYDHSDEVIYAFQRWNTKLVCWNAVSSSFVDVLASAVLNQPANSISILPIVRQRNKSSILLGSCIDGSLFFAQRPAIKQQKEVVSDAKYNNSKLNIQCVTSRGKRKKEHSKFIGCLSFVTGRSKNWKHETTFLNAGSKRKIAHVGDSHTATISVVVVYRFYIDNGIMVIAQNEIEVDEDGHISVDDSQGTEKNDISVSLKNILQQSDDVHLARVSVVGFGEGKKSACIHISVPQLTHVAGITTTNGFGVRNKSLNSDDQQFFFHVSLESGTILGVPVQLPSNTKRVSLVGTAVLAAETLCKSIVFYDFVRGSKMLSQSVSNFAKGELDTVSVDWFSMYSDLERSRIAVLYVKGGCLFIACSTLVTVSSVSGSIESNNAASLLLTSGRIPLAHGLATHFAGANDLMKLADDGNKIVQQRVTHVTLSSGLGFHETTISSARHGLDAAIELIRKSLLEPLEHGPIKNGKSSSTDVPLLEVFANAVEVLNGLKTTAATEIDEGNDSEPQAFVDGMIRVFCKYIAKLCTGPYQRQKFSIVDRQNLSDIQSILQICVRSGKFSCRQHLQGLFNVGFTMGLLKGGQVDSSQLNSPVELVLDILDKCYDVSERHMVIFLRYMLSKAKPADVANSFQQDRLNVIDEKYVKLSYQFDSVNSSDSKSTSEEQDIDKLKKRLILAGVNIVVDKICHLSDVNESLLRVAIANELDDEEIQLLCQIITKSLNGKTYVSNRDTISIFRRKLQWVKSLQVCQQQHTSNNATTSVTTISSEVHAMERLMSLHDFKRDTHGTSEGTTSKKGSLSTTARIVDSYDDSYLVEIL